MSHKRNVPREKTSQVFSLMLPPLHKPITLSEAQLRDLSWSDMRRVAARRIKSKIEEQSRQFNFNIERGKLNFGTDQVHSLLTNVSSRDLKDVINSWSYVMIHADVEGQRIAAAYLKDHPERMKHLASWTKVRCFSVHSENLLDTCKMQERGMQIIKGIMLMLTNARNNDTLKECVTSYFDRLRKMGHNQKSLQDCKSTFLSYLQEVLGGQWSPVLANIWMKVIDGILSIGFEYWKSKGIKIVEETKPKPRGRKYSRESYCIAVPNVSEFDCVDS